MHSAQPLAAPTKQPTDPSAPHPTHPPGPHREVGSPRTHRRFLNRKDGSYGPIPSRRPRGMLGMPFNRTAIPGLYCVGDSTFPGQGVNAVVFSGFGCGHRVACDLGLEQGFPALDGPYNMLLGAIRDRV